MGLFKRKASKERLHRSLPKSFSLKRLSLESRDESLVHSAGLDCWAKTIALVEAQQANVVGVTGA